MRTRKFLSAFLAIVMVLSLVTVPTFADGETTLTATSAEEFATALGNAKLATGDVVITLSGTIDMSNWTTVDMGAVSDNAYASLTVDGNGAVVTGLTQPIFGNVTYAPITVKNLTFQNSNVTNVANSVAGFSDVSGIIVGATGNGGAITLENIVVDGGSVTANNYAGAFIGYKTNGCMFTVKNCEVKNVTVTGGGSAGAFVGHINGEFEIIDTTVGGNTITTLDKAEKVGVLFGTKQGTASVASIDVTETTPSICKVNEEVIDSSLIGRLYGEVTFNGGEYFSNPTVTVLKDDTAVVTIDGVTVEYNGKYCFTVAKIGDTYYSSLADAIEGATEGDTIVVLAEEIELPKFNKNGLTIKTEIGTKITNKITNTNSDGGWSIEGTTFDGFEFTKQIGLIGKDLAVKNCKFTGYDGLYYGCASGTWTIENCEFNNTRYSLQVGEGTGVVNVIKCKFAGGFNTYAVEVNFIDCEFSKGSIYSIVQTHRYMTFTDCTFDETWPKGDDGYNFVGNAAETAVTEIYGNTTYAGGSIFDITCTDRGVFVVNPTKDENGLYTGGTFYKAPSADILAEGVTVTENADGTYIVCAEVAYVATIGEVGYTSLADAIAAANNGDTIKIVSEITLADTITIDTDDTVTIDLAGYTISGTDNATGNYELIKNKGNLTIKDSVGGGALTLTATTDRAWNNYSAVIANIGGTLTVEGGIIKHLGGTSMAYAIDNNSTIGNAELTISGGEVLSNNYRAVRLFANSTVYENTVEVTGGTVKGGSSALGNNAWSTAIWMQIPNADANIASVTVSENAKVGSVNVYAPYDASAITLEVASSALIQDDPAGVASVLSTLPENYDIINSNGVYGVEYAPIVATIGGVGYTSLADAIAAVPDNTATTIELADGTHRPFDYVLSNKNITFKGSQNAIIDNTDIQTNMIQTVGSEFTFEGVTVNFASGEGYQGIKDISKIVYKDCIINGLQYIYALTAVFDGCTFEHKTGYCVWTYRSEDVTFTDCKFNTGGKAILVYHEDEMHAEIKLTNCEFYSDKTYATNKAAVEIGSSPRSTETTYNVSFTDCTTDGNFYANNSTSQLWGNKNSMSTEVLNLVIDDELVYGKEEEPDTPVVGEVVIKSSAKTLSLTSYLYINQYFTVEGLDVDYVKENGVLLTWTEEVTDPSASFDSAYKFYDIVYDTKYQDFGGQTQGIPAASYQNLYYSCFAVKLADGTYAYSEVVPYSIEQYCNDALESSSASDKLKNVCTALLAYGAAAKLYFGN